MLMRHRPILDTATPNRVRSPAGNREPATCASWPERTHLPPCRRGDRHLGLRVPPRARWGPRRPHDRRARLNRTDPAGRNKAGAPCPALPSTRSPLDEEPRQAFASP